MRKLLLLLLLPVCSSAQTTFQYRYDCGYDEGGYIYTLPDSTYAVMGEISQTPGARSYLTRLDQAGTVQSAQSYTLGSAQQGATFGNGMPLSNGGYWFCINASTNGLTNSNRIMQTNANGNVVYTEFETLHAGNSEIFGDAMETSDGYIVGTSASYNSPVFSSPAISIFKMDTLGNLLWNIGIETDTVTPKECPTHIIETSDGNYVVCGRSMNPVNGSMDSYIVKVTPAGTVLWKNLYGTPNYELATGI